MTSIAAGAVSCDRARSEEARVNTTAVLLLVPATEALMG